MQSNAAVPESPSFPSNSIPKRKFRRWVIGTLIVTFVLLAMVAALVIVVDPFQHYRKASFYTPIAERALQRYMNVGFARNYEYDTLSLGSSITENTRTSDIERAFGGKALHLAYRAAALINYSMTMSNAFPTHDIKRVIITMDDVNLTDNPESGIEILPLYLFDDNILNDVSYWFNMDVLARIIELYEYNVHGTGKIDELDFDMLYNWTDSTLYGKARVFSSYAYWHKKKTLTLSTEPTAKVVQENIARHLLPFITAHPETEFILVYPPYSTLEWYNTYLFGQEERFLFGRVEYARALLAYPNVRIFDFQAHEGFANDYEQHTDLTHYSGAINTAYIEAMGRGECEVHSVEEVLANNEVIRGFFENFVPPTAEELAQMHEEANQQLEERLQWQ